jgi:hypothetical protein
MPQLDDANLQGRQWSEHLYEIKRLSMYLSENQYLFKIFNQSQLMIYRRMIIVVLYGKTAPPEDG